MSLVASVAFNISKEKKRKELMDTLAKLYEKASVSNKVFLMKRLFNMKMWEGGSVAYHLNEFNMVTNKLSYVKVDLDDEVREILILCSLSESWNGLVMGNNNNNNWCMRSLICGKKVLIQIGLWDSLFVGKRSPPRSDSTAKVYWGVHIIAPLNLKLWKGNQNRVWYY